MIYNDILNSYNIISFDLFDTVITRKVTNPTDIFLIIENILTKKSKRFENFKNLRVLSEFELRKKNDFQKEVTIEQIYQYLLSTFYPEELSNQNYFVSLELTIEKDNILINPELKELIYDIVISKTVIYISDIYLPKDFIFDLLTDLGLKVKKSNLFISSDIGLMKSNKELFKYVLNKLHIKPYEILHIGDNSQSDISNAKALGIKALQYKQCILNRYENISIDNSTTYSFINGVSRINRLHNPYKESDKKILWNTTSNVSAPIIFAFTLWCLNQAKQLKIKNLYFLSRDGQVLYKVAKKINKVLKYDIKLKYLYVSRQSLLFPAISSINKESLEWIMAPTSLLTPEIILKRINFKKNEIQETLTKFNFHNKMSKNLDTRERERFKELLISIEDKILKKASEYKENTKRYLSQEGLEKGPFSVIDVGWSGTLQYSISKLLNEEGYQLPIHGFYFGIKREKLFKNTDQMHAWFTHYKNPRKIDKETYIIPMTELFTSATHGGVLKHIKADNTYKPFLKETKNINGLKWGVNVQQESILSFTDLTCTQPLNIDFFLSKIYINILEQKYSLFLQMPTYDEAKAYGSYLDAEDQNESYHFYLAQAYNEKQDYHRLLNNSFVTHHNEWIEGSKILTEREIT